MGEKEWHNCGQELKSNSVVQKKSMHHNENDEHKIRKKKVKRVQSKYVHAVFLKVYLPIFEAEIGASLVTVCHWHHFLTSISPWTVQPYREVIQQHPVNAFGLNSISLRVCMWPTKSIAFWPLLDSDLSLLIVFWYAGKLILFNGEQRVNGLWSHLGLRLGEFHLACWSPGQLYMCVFVQVSNCVRQPHSSSQDPWMIPPRVQSTGTNSYIMHNFKIGPVTQINYIAITMTSCYTNV